MSTETAATVSDDQRLFGQEVAPLVASSDAMLFSQIADQIVETASASCNWPGGRFEISNPSPLSWLIRPRVLCVARSFDSRLQTWSTQS
jgi:hypothetical protein